MKLTLRYMHGVPGGRQYETIHFEAVAELESTGTMKAIGRDAESVLQRLQALVDREAGATLRLTDQAALKEQPVTLPKPTKQEIKEAQEDDESIMSADEWAQAHAEVCKLVGLTFEEEDREARLRLGQYIYRAGIWFENKAGEIVLPIRWGRGKDQNSYIDLCANPHKNDGTRVSDVLFIRASKYMRDLLQNLKDGTQVTMQVPLLDYQTKKLYIQQKTVSPAGKPQQQRASTLPAETQELLSPALEATTLEEEEQEEFDDIPF